MTKVLLFSSVGYDRKELDDMNSEELYDLACVDACTGYGDVRIMSLSEFSKSANDGEITLDCSWLYFVETNE